MSRLDHLNGDGSCDPRSTSDGKELGASPATKSIPGDSVILEVNGRPQRLFPHRSASPATTRDRTRCLGGEVAEIRSRHRCKKMVSSSHDRLQGTTACRTVADQGTSTVRTRAWSFDRHTPSYRAHPRYGVLYFLKTNSGIL